MSRMSNEDPRRERLLDAAQAVFARYGYKRASMGDVAAEAGVSRPALYLHFRSKEDVLRSLAGRMRTLALEGARAGWAEGRGFAANLAATLLGKEAHIFPVLYGAPHGAELLTANPALTEAIAGEIDQGFRALLTARFEAAAKAGAIDLTCVGGDAGALAGLVASSAKALLSEAKDEAGFAAALDRLARVIAAAVRAD